MLTAGLSAYLLILSRCKKSTPASSWKPVSGNQLRIDSNALLLLLSCSNILWKQKESAVFSFWKILTDYLDWESKGKIVEEHFKEQNDFINALQFDCTLYFSTTLAWYENELSLFEFNPRVLSLQDFFRFIKLDFLHCKVLCRTVSEKLEGLFIQLMAHYTTPVST